ncbi:MAG: hypothetical protein AB7F35_26520 [Acetobacteraceae bacterium]
MHRIKALGAATGLVLATLPLASALGAEPRSVLACPTREQLEQVIQSNGAVTPDSCRRITITAVDSPAGSLCLMKFGANNNGIIGTLKDMAADTEWWTPCRNIGYP